MLIHFTLMGAAEEFGFTLIGEGFAATGPAKPEIEQVDLDTTCRGDAMLAAAARAATCLAPWRADAPECTDVDTLQMSFWMELSGCTAKSETLPATAMTMATQKEIEKVTPIDPEPLLEELAQQDKPPPPPPIPQLQQQQPAPPPPPPPPAPPPPKRPMQVVETKPNNDKEPDNARFLAENNSVAEKQKVARGSVKEPMTAKAKPEELTVKDKPKDEVSMKEPPKDDPGKNQRAPQVPGTLAMRPPGSPSPQEAPQDARIKGEKGERQPIVSDGFIPRRGDGAVEQQRRDPGQQTKGQGGAGGGTPQVPNLKPTKEVLERIAGGGSVDHLEEVENGDETALNAKRWVYASFFNRLKRQVAQNWDPQTVWRRVDPQGSHHGYKTRVTEVRVSLSSKGELSKIVVVNPSGVNELDEEALRAFHAAAPFPNPPDGLVGKDGSITFAFSFYFEIGAPHTSWRVIRSQ